MIGPGRIVPCCSNSWLLPKYRFMRMDAVDAFRSAQMSQSVYFSDLGLKPHLRIISEPGSLLLRNSQFRPALWQVVHSTAIFVQLLAQSTASLIYISSRLLLHPSLLPNRVDLPSALWLVCRSGAAVGGMLGQRQPQDLRMEL